MSQPSRSHLESQTGTYDHVHVAGSGCCKGEASAKGIIEQIGQTVEQQKQAALTKGYSASEHAQQRAQQAGEQIQQLKAHLHEQVEQGAQAKQDLVAKQMSGMQDTGIKEAEARAAHLDKQKQTAISGVESEAQKSAQRVANVEERERERLQHVADQHLHGVQADSEKPGLIEKIKHAVGLGEESKSGTTSATETVQTKLNVERDPSHRTGGAEK